MSYLESNARERVHALFDANSFEEFLPPSARVVSPHLGQLNAPVSFDDGVVIGSARLGGKTVFIAAQEGGFMGGAVGEVHGANSSGCYVVPLQNMPMQLCCCLNQVASAYTRPMRG